MARTPGTLSLGSNIEPKMAAPLDGREVVNSKADLLASTSFPYFYEGMTVYVKSEHKSYTLIGSDTTVEANWQEVGSGAGQTIQVDTLPAASADNVGTIYQYVGETTATLTNGYYYKCVEDTTASPSTYEWDNIPVQDGITVDSAIDDTSANPVENQAIAAALDEKQDIIQYDVMPVASASIHGQIVQFIGLTTATYQNGYYYKCVEDIDNPGTYIWQKCKVQDGDVNTIETIQLNGTAVTPDANKAVNILAIPMAQKGASEGVAELDANGKVPSSQLPSYVDDVVEGYLNPADGKFYEEDTYTTEIDGETGKIYIDLSTEKTYRWSGTVFAEISESLALGETSSTAYAGNKGKQNADDIADLKTDKQDVLQFSTMPTPLTVDDVGRIVQYTGTTTTAYTSGYFYECIEDPESAGAYIWTAKNVQDGGSGGGELGINITAAIDVGGIDAGTSYSQGTSYDTLWNDLLNPTLYPTFTAPSASLAYSANTYYAVGATIASKAATLTYNAGAITLNGTKQNDRGGAATNFAIATTGADTEYSDSSASSGSFTVPALTRATKGTIVMTGTVDYAAGPQPLDSKGGNYGSPLAAGTATASKTLTFIQPYYYGVSNNSAISDFTGLTENVTAKGQKTFNFTTSNQYMVFAYDSSYGTLSSILDSNGFETISGWNRTTLTVNGFNYYVYMPKAPTTDTAAAFTFKY
mgnify:CR=1 FL=1